MKKTISTYIYVFLGVLLFGNTMLGQSPNKPTGDTQSATQQGSITLSVPGNYNTTNGVLNSVATYSVFKKGLSLNDILQVNAPLKHVVLSTQYMDGLGRPIQTVGRKRSPAGNDVVEMTFYDPFGREAQSFLPYTISETDGSFKATAFSDQVGFYDTHFGGREDIYYGLKVYDGSPLNRVIKDMAAGNSWVGNNKGTETQLLYNTVSVGGGPDGHDVQLWTIGDLSSDVPVYSGLYAENELVLTLVTNEDQNMIREFRNRENRIVLRQVQIGNTPSEGHTGWLSTYYIHDDRGNLRFVLPPKAVEELIAANGNYANADIGDLIFKYVFDKRNRMITSKVPGAGEVYFVYDLLDREVLTQNAEQRKGAEKTWRFKKYDAQNREAFSGFITTNDDRAALQQEADGWGGQDYFVKREGCGLTGIVEGQSITISEHVNGTTVYRAKGFIEFLPGFDTDEEFETETGGSLCGDYTYYQGYYDASFPLLKDYGVNDKFEIVSVNYYDDYEFTSKSWDTDFIGMYTTTTELTDNLTEVPEKYDLTIGLSTGSKLRVLGTDEWLTSVTYYDDEGREVQVQVENHLGGTDVTTTQYNFASQVLNTFTKHHNPSAIGDKFVRVLKRFTYDNTGQIEKIEQSLNNGPLKILSVNSYNELSELASKELGTSPANPNAPLETLNHDYNIRGWMTGINGIYANSGTGNHYFGMQLAYDYGFDNTELTGNIAGVIWRTQSSSRKRAFGFEYDNANRLMGADYNHLGEQESSWSKNVTGSGTRDFSSAYTYDANGNTLTLLRKGVIAGTTATIDDLEYSYGRNGTVDNKSNQLIRVKESSSSPSLPDGFNNSNGASVDYTYDDNGNLDLDSNKDITSVSYNYLNLPVLISFSNGRSISFGYDAGGTRLSKIVNDKGDIIITDYVSTFNYQNNELQFFGHEEGRTRKDTQGNYVYDFFLKDHLGNTRMTLTETPEVVEYRATMETDITPTGVDLGDYEEKLFLNLSNTRQTPSSYNTSVVTGITNNESVRLNGTNALRRIGPAKMLAVFPGDQVSLSVESFHAGGASTTYVDTKTQTIDALAGVFAQLGGSTTTTEGALKDLFEGPGTTPSTYVGAQGNINKPRAYLNYLVLNQDFEYVDGGFIQSDQTNGWKTLSTNLNITEGGFVYVYLSNEHPTSFDVWFDDLNIVHTKSTILQEDHYYPYGMNIDALSGKAPQAKSNNFKYNGFEEQTSFDLDWYDYQARQYDPQLGRFLSVDPAGDLMRRHSLYNYAFDNPIRYTDPDGMMPQGGGNKLVPGVRIKDRGGNNLLNARDGLTKQLNQLAGRSLTAEEVGLAEKAFQAFKDGKGHNARLTKEVSVDGASGKIFKGDPRNSHIKDIKKVITADVEIIAEYSELTDLNMEGEITIGTDDRTGSSQSFTSETGLSLSTGGDLPGLKVDIGGSASESQTSSSNSSEGKTTSETVKTYKYSAKVTLKARITYNKGTKYQTVREVTLEGGENIDVEITSTQKLTEN